MKDPEMALARQYIFDPDALTPASAVLEESLAAFARSLQEMDDDKMRASAYHEVNLALCQKRDSLRNTFHIDTTLSSAKQIKALAAHPEGGMLLGAFVLLNRNLAIYAMREFVKKDKRLHHRSYNEDDLVEVALYGTLGRVVPYEETEEPATQRSYDFQGGLLAAAINYNPEKGEFATFAMRYMELTLRNFYRQNRQQNTLRWPGDFQRVSKPDERTIRYHARTEKTATSDILAKERTEAIEAALSMLTPRQEQVMRMRMESIRPTEIAKILHCSRQTVYNTERDALITLRSSGVLSLLLPFKDVEIER